MRLPRRELLNRLLAVEPGLSRARSVRQSDCVVFRNGRLYTLSQEVACSMPSLLPREWSGAVQAGKLIEVLKALPDEEVAVDLEGPRLTARGKGRRSSFVLEAEVLLPVGEVGLPAAGSWRDLDPAFPQAADLAGHCVKSSGEFTQECVHVTPSFLEACDNLRMLRYTVPTFLAKPALVRGTGLRKMADLGMTQGAETGGWLHFRNPAGLRLSVCKFAVDKYPPLGEYLQVRGRAVTLASGLEAATKLAAVFNKDSIVVRVGGGTLTVTGSGPDGDYEQTHKSDYAGPPLAFSVPPKVLADLAGRGPRCEVTPVSLRAEAGRYVFVATLEEDK